MPKKGNRKHGTAITAGTLINHVMNMVGKQQSIEAKKRPARKANEIKAARMLRKAQGDLSY